MWRDRILIAAAGLSLAWAALAAIAGSVVTLGGGLAAGVGLLVARRWGPPRLRGAVVYLLFVAVACEGGLQLAALGGILPGVDICTHVPYGRLYWTREGFANETMNRRGWHAPAFRFDPSGRRVVLIGDSFVQAIQVPTRETLGALLDRRLRGMEVLALGRSGIGPAHYLELLRHAVRHYEPTEAVIFLFLGNDFSDLDPAMRGRAPQRYYYMGLDADGQPRPLAASEPALREFRADLERNEQGWIHALPWIAKSHFLLPGVLRGVRRVLQGGDAGPPPPDLPAELAREGIRAAFFRDPMPQDAAQVHALAEALLDACVAEARAHGIGLRVVTIPYFPERFYARGPATGWTRVVDGLDFAAPDRRLEAWAHARGVALLALGSEMARDGLARADVERLYFGGTGHFTAAGHRYAADAVARAFFGAR